MKPRELTLRGLILGVLLTTVFTAANVYLGLKVGLTFASSIPAAVISMAILSRGEGLVDPREQHRADRRLRGRHALGDHLRPARAGDRRLVDGVPLLAVVPDLPERRRARRAVHDPAPARARHQLRPAVSRRRRRGRGAEGRLRHARRDDGRHRRVARRADARSSSAPSPRRGSRSSRRRASPPARSPASSGSARRRRAATTSPGRSRCSAPATSSACRSAWRCWSGW